MASDIEKKCPICSCSLVKDALYCHYCGFELPIPEQETILNYNECPMCGKRATLRVERVLRPWRYHVCKVCGWRGESVEVWTDPDRRYLRRAEQVLKFLKKI